MNLIATQPIFSDIKPIGCINDIEDIGDTILESINPDFGVEGVESIQRDDFYKDGYTGWPLLIYEYVTNIASNWEINKDRPLTVSENSLLVCNTKNLFKGILAEKIFSDITSNSRLRELAYIIILYDKSYKYVRITNGITSEEDVTELFYENTGRIINRIAQADWETAIYISNDCLADQLHFLIEFSVDNYGEYIKSVTVPNAHSDITDINANSVLEALYAAANLLDCMPYYQDFIPEMFKYLEDYIKQYGATAQETMLAAENINSRINY
jgi:hypothetical protein